VGPWYGAAGRFYCGLAPVHQTQHHSPARAWAGRHHPGVVGEPAAGCIPYVPPVGGWGRLGASFWPQIRRWDRRRCCWRISGPPGGPETRWVLSVGWCPSKRVVVIHYARPYIAQKVSGGCVTAISGNRSWLRRMRSLRRLRSPEEIEGKRSPEWRQQFGRSYEELKRLYVFHRRR
jgi:hypothetical protein